MTISQRDDEMTANYLVQERSSKKTAPLVSFPATSAHSTRNSRLSDLTTRQVHQTQMTAVVAFFLVALSLSKAGERTKQEDWLIAQQNPQSS